MSVNTLKPLRIFVASPSDVASERARLVSVVEQLNGGFAEHLGIVLQLKEWSSVLPQMGRAQQIIFDQIPVTTWDLMIGILWQRYGTPSGGANPNESGTHEEFNVAVESWKQTGKPRIMFYRCTRPPEDITKIDLDSLTKINAFFKEFETGGKHQGLYRAYDTPENFERLVRGHLEKFLIEYSEKELRKTITPEEMLVYAPPKIPNNLPRRLAFFGRAKEMDKVLGAIGPDERGWGVVIDGIGGIGKTALALEAAFRAQDRARFDAFVFLTAKMNILEASGVRDLTPATTTLDSFINETARVLGQPGIAQLTGEDKKRALLDALRATRALLIYDNLETLSESEQKELADFLRFLPQNSKAILTSRRRGGESALWLRLEKLDWDAARQIIADEAKKDARLADKLKRVGEAHWEKLYDETKGSPLALTRTLGLMRTRATLSFDGALEMLRGNRDLDLQKFIFQEARKELKDNDLVALRALAFFVLSAPFDALIQVAELSRNALEMSLDRLDALSLLDKLEGTDRYALHPLTRAFVRDELLTDVKVARETGMRFARYWVDYAKQYGGYGKESYKTYDRLEAEWTNLDAAANWLWETANVRGESVEDKDAARMLDDLARALSRFLHFGGRWDEEVQVNTYCYEAMCVLQEWNKAAENAFNLGKMFHYRSHLDDATHWVKQALKLYRQTGNKMSELSAEIMLGAISQKRGDAGKANEIFQSAIAQMRNLGLDDDLHKSFTNVLEALAYNKEVNFVEELLRKSLDLATIINDRNNQVFLYLRLASFSIRRRDWNQARETLNRAFALANEIGNTELIAEAKYGLALVDEAEGNADLALPLAQEALKIYERLQHGELAAARELVARLTPPP